jgi:hypothetical protein
MMELTLMVSSWAKAGAPDKMAVKKAKDRKITPKKQIFNFALWSRKVLFKG